MEEKATWNWAVKSAPLDKPEIEMPLGSMFKNGSGAGAAVVAIAAKATEMSILRMKD
jgi:hypothetical protein